MESPARKSGAEPATAPPPSLLPGGVTLVLCLVTLATAILQSLWGVERVSQAIGLQLGNLANPATWFRAVEGQTLPTCLTLFTYVFPHGGWWHVLPNVTALWVFGAIAESALGARRFLICYFIAGIVGAFCYALVVPNATAPLAGASLAIAGVMGAYGATRWASAHRYPALRRAVFFVEIAAVVGVVSWLFVRDVPARPDVLSSVMYHLLPFLVMWLGIRAYERFRKVT